MLTIELKATSRAGCSLDLVIAISQIAIGTRNAYFCVEFESWLLQGRAVIVADTRLPNTSVIKIGYCGVQAMK